jgi:hypothetical protein
VSLHGRHNPGVVGSLAEHLMLHHQSVPCLKDGSLVSKNTKALHQHCQVRLGLVDTHTKSILVNRSRGNDPEFVKHLWNDGESLVAKAKCLDSRDSYLM